MCEVGNIAEQGRPRGHEQSMREGGGRLACPYNLVGESEGSCGTNWFRGRPAISLYTCTSIGSLHDGLPIHRGGVGIPPYDGVLELTVSGVLQRGAWVGRGGGGWSGGGGEKRRQCSGAYSTSSYRVDYGLIKKRN